MNDKISERRQSERMPTEIQGKVDGEKCFITNLSDGGLHILFLNAIDRQSCVSESS